VTIDKRQSSGLGGLLSGAASMFMTDMPAFKIVNGTTGMKRPGIKNIKIYHGPLKLLPAAEVCTPFAE
jgi:hypothetical protein